MPTAGSPQQGTEGLGSPILGAISSGAWQSRRAVRAGLSNKRNLELEYGNFIKIRSAECNGATAAAGSVIVPPGSWFQMPRHIKLPLTLPTRPHPPRGLCKKPALLSCGLWCISSDLWC